MSVAVETFGFFMAALGLLMLGVTLPNSYWRVSTVHGNVITTNTIFENLWYSCATDSLGVYNCWEFPSMLALSGVCGMVAISWYAFNITRDFFNPSYQGTKARPPYKASALRSASLAARLSPAAADEEDSSFGKYGKNAYV
uniref:Claudin n=1 Tax=Equus caballus TaxID=9796 RepID=A0A9L0TBE9_HORSE